MKFIIFYKIFQMKCLLQNVSNHCVYFVASIFLLYIIDRILLKLKNNNTERWFKLHVISNVIVCLFTFNNFIHVLTNPLESLPEINDMFDITLIPSNIVLALHIYHICMFSNLAIIDWVHHIVMCAILLLTFVCPNIILTNYHLFVVNGLPGGIDYMLLIFVKQGRVDKFTEKKINSKLNIWIRGPGILIGAYIIYLQWRYSIIHYPIYLVSLVIVGLYWNAQYFTERVVYNYGVTTSHKPVY